MGHVTEFVRNEAAFDATLKAFNRQMVKDTFVDIITAGLCNNEKPRTMAEIAEQCGLKETQLRCIIAHDSWLSVRLLADIATLLDIELTITARLPGDREPLKRANIG